MLVEVLETIEIPFFYVNFFEETPMSIVSLMGGDGLCRSWLVHCSGKVFF